MVDVRLGRGQRNAFIVAYVIIVLRSGAVVGPVIRTPGAGVFGVGDGPFIRDDPVGLTRLIGVALRHPFSLQRGADIDLVGVGHDAITDLSAVRRGFLDRVVESQHGFAQVLDLRIGRFDVAVIGARRIRSRTVHRTGNVEHEHDVGVRDVDIG